jgi:hypothetical protein
MIGLFCCILVSIIYIIKIFHNYGYGYIPRAGEINKYYQELLLFYKKQKRKIEFEYIQFLIDSFCEYTDMNTINNEKKLHYISQARTAIIGSIIFIIACSVVNAVPYINNFFK